METILPAILGFLGGPAGGLAGAGLQWLAGKFGASSNTVEAIREALNNHPGGAVELRKIDIEFQEFCLQNSIALQLAQIDVNKTEAANTNWFVAGWRPAVGWTGAMGLLYMSVIEPIARFIATMWGYHGTFPAIDTNLTMQVLMGLLGLGAMRTYEKAKDAEGNR